MKIALSVVDEDALAHLKKTIAWVRDGMHADLPLPKVATAIVDLPPNPSAQIVVYRRKAPDPRLPHLVGEFRLGCYVYVFAIPFSDQDSWDLVGFFEDEAFRDLFRHYTSGKDWEQLDLSRLTPIRLNLKLTGAAKF